MHHKFICSFLIFITVLLPLSCEQKTPNNPNNSENEIQNTTIDSITHYLNEANNKEYTVEKRKKFAWKAYAITPKLNDSLKPKYLHNIGNRFDRVNDHENYKFFNHKTLKIAIRNDNKKVESRVYYNLGWYYLEKNYRSDSAYYYNKKAEKAYIELKDTLRIGMCLRNIGTIQENENDFLGSETSSKKAIYYFELVKDNLLLSYSYITLGNAASDLDQFEDAINYYTQALVYKRKMPDRSSDSLSETYSLNNIGKVYEKQKMYEKALSYYKQALAYDNFFNELPGFYSLVLSNIAHANFKLGNTKNLPQLYFEALKISDSLNEIPDVINIKMHLSEFYKATDSIELAKKHGYEAKKLSEKSKHKGKLLKVLLMLSQIETDEKALEFTNLYIKMQDSLKKNEINTAKIQFEKINQDLNVVTQQNEEITLQKEIISNKNKLLALLVLLLFITFTTLYFLRQKKYEKYKEKFDQILSEQENTKEKNETLTNKKKELDLDKNIVNTILLQLKEFENSTEFLQKGITVIELSKKINTNPKYLSKVINYYKEKNFITYINDLKINYAVKQLQYNEKFKHYTIKAISDEIGFNNAQTFSATFYKKTGINPSYFINQLNKLDDEEALNEKGKRKNK